MPILCLLVRPREASGWQSRRLLADAHTLGLKGITGLERHELYFIEGAVSPPDLERLAAGLLSDPTTQTCVWRQAGGRERRQGDGHVIETTLQPGVTDPVAEQIVRAARVLGIQGVGRAASGQRFVVHGDALREQDLHTLARRLLVNPLIQRYALGAIEPVFPQAAQASCKVESIPIRDLDDDALLQLSRARRAALDLAEMQAVRAYFRDEGRDPTDVEFETIAQTWSEHCIHKTFKAQITVSSLQSPIPDSIDGVLNTCIRAATEAIAAPWVLSAFEDNAGVIEFDDEYEVSFKVETHNHPSAIEPFGGANTGVGGVIRDILGVSHKPIAATDVLCFGPQDVEFQALPDGVLHPRRIRSGVVAGIQDYGNKIGLPTVNGAVVYDEGFTANPLVFCGCAGMAPKGSHPRRPQPGDRVILIGGRTGRDGLRGATFSSMTMNTQTGHVAGAAVQIGDPIVEKGLVEVITRARDRRLYHAITDCGAGGLSSAVGETAAHIGAEVDLARVPLKYPGLAPWEIWLSEAQERMVLAVPPADVARLQSLCEEFEVELVDIGAFDDTGRLVARYGGKDVLDLENEFLFAGLPGRSLQAVSPPTPGGQKVSATHNTGGADLRASLLALLSHPNIASKADVIRVYDHEVQGGTVVKPLTGLENDGPSDACVLRPLGVKGLRGIVLSNGVNPQFGKHDPYRMALSVVDEAIRNAVAVGADPHRIALLDNFCWGDPLCPETLGTLVEAARGCHDAALHYGAPFISGKDSLNNEYLGADGRRHAIPPTLLISAIGIVPDVTQAVTMDLKEAGDAVYLLGKTRPEFGGSHFSIISGQSSVVSGGEMVPSMPRHAPALYRALHYAMRAGLVRACHDLSEGGLAVAAAEMSIAGRLGLTLTLETEDPLVALFSESNGRFLVEVRAANCQAFEAHFGTELASQVQRIGAVTDEPRLSIAASHGALLSVPVPDLVAAWNPGDNGHLTTVH